MAAVPLQGVEAMRTLSHAHTAASSHGIDLAPMLDFVVNLLIFFLVTAVFIRQAGVEVARPSGETAAEEKPSKSIVVDSHGEISVDGNTIDFRSVRAHIEQFRAANPDGGGVVVVADREAPTWVVVGVIDEIHLGGIDDITFTTTLLREPD
jgi:biopolymer transport protein ExbD